MDIIFYDGSVLHCEEIEIGLDVLIADGCRMIPLYEVLRIVSC